MLIVGLDVSTSVVGICYFDPLDRNATFKEARDFLAHVTFENCNTLWEKADKVRSTLATLFENVKIDILVVEEIAKVYSPGMSSAGTITKLAAFNALISYIAREHFKVDPIHISPAECRRLCGLKMVPKKKDPNGRSHKQQTFDTMLASDLKDYEFPRKKATKKNSNPDYVSWAYDEVDAYALCKAMSRRVKF